MLVTFSVIIKCLCRKPLLYGKTTKYPCLLKSCVHPLTIYPKGRYILAVKKLSGSVYIWGVTVLHTWESISLALSSTAAFYLFWLSHRKSFPSLTQFSPCIHTLAYSLRTHARGIFITVE